MCSTRLLARAKEFGVWRPAGNDARCILHVENCEIALDAAAHVDRAWFLFVCRVDRDLPDVEAIEFSFSTPHGYTSYDPISNDDRRIRPALCAAMSDILRFTLAAPDPASWTSRDWDPRRIGEQLGVPPEDAATAYRGVMLTLMRDKTLASLTVEPAMPDPEWKAERDKREFLPHHVARAKGPFQKGQYIGFGVLAHDGRVVAGRTGDATTSGSSALTYWEATHASRVYGASHEWDPRLMRDEYIVYCLAHYFTLYSPHIYRAWSPPIPRMLRGIDGPLHPIPGESKRFLDCLWTVQFARAPGREPLEGFELFWEWDPYRLQENERTIPISSDPPPRLTREMIRQVAEINGFRYEELIIPLIVEAARQDGGARVQKAWLKRVLDMPDNRLREALALAGRRLTPQGNAWIESRSMIGIKPEFIGRATTFTAEVLAQDRLAAVLCERFDEFEAAAARPGTSRNNRPPSRSSNP